MSVRIDIQNVSGVDGIPDTDFVNAWVAWAVDAAGGDGHREVSVRIVDSDEMRALNRDYRGKDKPTNVLSFPAGSIAGLPAGEPEPLGDIVVCAGVVRDEATAQGKAIPDHWAHMLVHGVLHLLGHDHESDAEAAAMEALETSVLGAHGVNDPYRAHRKNC